MNILGLISQLIGIKTLRLTQPTLLFNNSESIASATFDLIHSDVWGPLMFPQWGGQDILLFLSIIFLVTLGFI